MKKFNQIVPARFAPAVLILLSSLVVVLPTLVFGVYKGADTSQHFQFADTYERAIVSGEFYPSWAAHENLGYGSVGVRFYPPLFSFSLGLAHLIVGNWHLAFCFVLFFFSATGATAIYWWAKEFYEPRAAVWAAAVFNLMPYHLNQIYNLSVFAEFAGCSVLAFCFLFVTRICGRGKTIDVIGLAASYAVLILIHLPSAVIGSLCLLIYGLANLKKSNFAAALPRLFAAALLGLAASSVYWLRMVTELSWMRITKFRDDIVFDYTQNFLLTAAWFDGRQYWFLNTVFLTAIFMVGLAVFALYKSGSSSTLQSLRPTLFLFCLSVFMSTAFSQPIWTALPFLSEVQFPFRWLTVSVASGALIVGAGSAPFVKIADLSARWRQIVHGLAAILVVMLTLTFSLTWISISNSHHPKESFDGWVEGKINDMGFDFFWTTPTKEEAFSIMEKVVADNRQAEISAWAPEDRVFTVEAGNPTKARVATLYYPHWRASVNGAPAETEIAGDGTILVPLPAEAATVRIWFEEPLYIQIAGYVSLFAWLAFTAFGLFTLFKNGRLNFFAGRQAKTVFSE